MKQIHMTVLCLIPLMAATGHTEEWPNRPLIGINLDRPTYHDTSVPFADLMKRSRPWMYGWGKDQEPAKIDALGNWIPEPATSIRKT